MKFIFVMLFSSLFIQACSDKQESAKPGSSAIGRKKVTPKKDTQWVAKAKELTKQYQLTSLAIECLSFEEDATANAKKHIGVREVHNDKCGGDQQTAPRIFSFEVDVSTGEYKTNRYSIITGGDYESMDKLSRHLLE